MPSQAPGSDPFARRPQVPAALHPLGREILEEFTRHPESRNVILGGGVALQHYLDLRPTVDLDAWWAGTPDQTTRDTIAHAVGLVAAAHGYGSSRRGFGDTESFEIVDGDQKVFAFQIARRSVQLDEPLDSAWPPVKIETLRDNAAAKMNALVNRGAPRDFIDIRNLCTSGRLSIADCWNLWKVKNSDHSVEQAIAATLTKLHQIEARRPLSSIHEERERAAAHDLREWFHQSFCQFHPV